MVLSVAAGRPSGEERTCFQTPRSFQPEIDIQADVAVCYGPRGNLGDRVASWRTHGYRTHFMTGIAWGNYQDYFGGRFDGREHWAEVQTRRNGSRMPHGRSRDVFYNVPTPQYTEYLKTVVKKAVDAGVTAIHLEEPEFWVAAGYSDAFKAAWQREYGEPWQPPHSSVEARYRSGRLKQRLYTQCLEELFRYAKSYARAQDRTIRCFVPTHSLINYAHWRIVSPEGNLMAIDEADGYIAQVWTGTARTPNLYAGELRERTFETAFLEYGQMVNMVRPSGRRCYLLHDPVEDNPNHSWRDYRRNWEATVVASLFRPEGYHFEVMPWPGRVLTGRFPAADGEGAARVRIPPDYATEVMVVTQALRNMKQSKVEWDCGSGGVGVLVSDSIMFQRGAPAPPDPHLSSFFGLALPLLKHGIPVEVVSLENVGWRRALRPYRVLLLTYENQKPLRRECHEPLVDWVRAGGSLLYFDGGDDPFDRVREWWNDGGQTTGTAGLALLRAMGVDDNPREGFHRVGRGWLGYFKRSPRELAQSLAGADFVRDMVARAFKRQRRLDEWKTRNYLGLKRGPYVITAVLDESTAETPVRLTGRFVDLFDPALPVIAHKALKPGARSLLYDLDTVKGRRPRLIAAACRAHEERADRRGWSAVLRGPADTVAVARLWLPRAPDAVECAHPKGANEAAWTWNWDEVSGTVWMRFANAPDGVRITVRMK